MVAVTGSENASKISVPAAAAQSPTSENRTGSPQSRAGARPVSSPWTQIVRGELEMITAAPSSPSAAAAAVPAAALSFASAMSSAGEEENPENGGGGAAGKGKTPVWIMPSNGSSSPELSGVMGAEAWPALSEAARAPSKLNLDPPKGSSDGSSSILPTPQVTQTGSSISLKQEIDNANTNSTPSHPMASRPRPVKRNGQNVSANGSTFQPPGLQSSVGEAYSNNSSPRDHNQRSSQSRGTNDHTQQLRNPYRNRGGGRGESSQYHNYGGRRDHDRTNQDWNSQNFNGRDAHLQPQRGSARYSRQPPPPPPPPLPLPTSAPYMLMPTSVRGFGPPQYPDSRMYYPPPGPFFVAPISPVFYPPPALQQLYSDIVVQIDFYFSNENLVRDTFLRKNMDDQGWVLIKLIAGFKKMLQLTGNVQLIADAIRGSVVVEVQGDKVRRRDDWARWIMPPALHFPKVADAGNSSHDVLSDSVQSMVLSRLLVIAVAVVKMNLIPGCFFVVNHLLEILQTNLSHLPPEKQACPVFQKVTSVTPLQLGVHQVNEVCFVRTLLLPTEVDVRRSLAKISDILYFLR